MIIIDSAGIIRYANRQVTALFGYPHDDIIGREVELLMPQRYRTRHQGHRERYNHSGKIRPMGPGLELFGRRVDGREFPVEISLSPIEDAGHSLTAAAIRDVSGRKRVEAELIVARESAEQLQSLAHGPDLAAVVIALAVPQVPDPIALRHEQLDLPTDDVIVRIAEEGGDLPVGVANDPGAVDDDHGIRSRVEGAPCQVRWNRLHADTLLQACRSRQTHD